MTTEVKMRCPIGPKRLFGILRQNGEEPKFTQDNLIEFACADCRKALRQQGKAYALVLHRYNFLGELVETHLETSV